MAVASAWWCGSRILECQFFTSRALWSLLRVGACSRDFFDEREGREHFVLVQFLLFGKDGIKVDDSIGFWLETL